uniref:C2H2-type domain-containing protein n=1 Tax=Strongyloides papillosus TaxID=174720 RepID=A0A0N5BZN1_STREA
MNNPTCRYCNIKYDHEFIGYHMINCQNEEYYNCPYFDCKQKKNFKKANLIKHLNNKHFKQITKPKSNICLENSVSQNIDQLLKKYAFDNKLSDKAILSAIDLIEDIAKLTKSYNLIMCLKKCSIRKDIKEKNLKVIENNEFVPVTYFAGRHSNPRSYIKTIREEIKIMFIDIKSDLKNHIIQNNLIKYIDSDHIYVILYLDDVNFFKDSTNVPKKGMITNMAYRLILSKKEFIKPLITSSSYEYFRTFGLCLQKHSKLSMYEREIRFAVKKFKDVQLNILDKTFSVKVHALIGK